MRALLLLLPFLCLPACGPGAGAYCQTGPKYGTQCYAERDVKEPPGRPRGEDPARER